MKVGLKVFCATVVLSVLTGCASNGVYVPKVPFKAQAKIMEYNEQPESKIFILAVDLNGRFAYGSASGQESLKEAAKIAVAMCDESRAAQGVSGKPYIYSINDKVVYKEMIQKDQKSK